MINIDESPLDENTTCRYCGQTGERKTGVVFKGGNDLIAHIFGGADAKSGGDLIIAKHLPECPWKLASDAAYGADDDA